MVRPAAALFPNLAPDPLPTRTPGTASEKGPEDPASARAGWLLAHCDGGSRGNPGPAGYGALLQDESGSVLAELSEFLGTRTNNYAEYRGLLGCLEWALDHGYRRLRVISDSELMVKQIQGKYKVNSADLRPLWEQARRRIARLDRFEISHALRHKNRHADQLANQAMDRGAQSRTLPSRHGPIPGAGDQAAPGRSTGAADAAKPNLSGDSAPEVEFSARPARGSSASRQISGPPTSSRQMLRGFTRNGVVHFLGEAVLPDGIFVKVIPE